MDAAECRRTLRDFIERGGFNPPPRRGRGGIGVGSGGYAVPARFNPPPRRGRGGMAKLQELPKAVQVSIRRRVVDAAEYDTMAVDF